MTAPGTRRWTASGAVARALGLLRRGAVRPLAFGVLGETVYRRLVVFERDLQAVDPATETAGLAFGFLGEERLAEYEALRPGHSARAAARLADGHRCWGTWIDGDLACVRWVATGTPHIEYLDLDLVLEAGEVFAYDTFTAPVHRRRGISAASQRRLGEVLREEGHLRLVRAVLPENRAGFQDAIRGGFRPCGRVGYVGLGRWRHELGGRRA